MQRSRLKLYLPFIALVVAQALFVALAPSKPGSGNQVAAFGNSGGGDNGSVDNGGTGGGSTGSGGGTTGDTSATGGASASGGSGSAAGGGATAGGASAGGGAAGIPTKGDTSHCVNGRQEGITNYAPKCVPKFTGNNGGATYQGVTDKEIKVVYFREKANEQVNAVLRPQGLAASDEEYKAFADAAIEFLNKRYEFYGRKIKMEMVIGDCPQTPPDPTKCKAAAREVVNKKPFLVIWATPLYPDVFDEWARAGIPSIGGWAFDDKLFTQRRPYRYDVLTDGTKAAKFIGEYYCKKMAKQPAKNAGPVIHSSIGPRDSTPRRLGIIIPDTPANVATAKTLQSIVGGCDAQQPVIATYESDITRAQEQTSATVASFLQAKVTTVVCMCDPIAPSFATRGFTAQRYFPEWLLSGTGLLDYDKLGRLYDPPQWTHAFGPSELANAVPFAQQDQSKIWRDVGRSGSPCQPCALPWGYFSQLGAFLQSAGPNLNPLTLERGVFSLEPRGGTATVPLYKFGPGDYTALEDVREVYWDAAAKSAIDGQNGAYIALDQGRRYQPGQIPSGFRIPVKPN